MIVLFLMTVHIILAVVSYRLNRNIIKKSYLKDRFTYTWEDVFFIGSMSFVAPILSVAIIYFSHTDSEPPKYL